MNGCFVVSYYYRTNQKNLPSFLPHCHLSFQRDPNYYRTKGPLPHLICKTAQQGFAVIFGLTKKKPHFLSINSIGGDAHCGEADR